MSFHPHGRRRLFLLLLLQLHTFILCAQGAIKGKITDALSGTAIGRASVFINNTTYARIGDENGNFELDRFPALPFELTITAVGYETMTLRINRFPDVGLIVKLKQKSIDLGEVTIVSPDKDGWVKYGKEFIEAFIGYSEYAGQCELLNHKALEFRYDRISQTLTVSATEPLRIRNKATGYEITYWLEDFEKNYGTRKLFFRGYALFAPLVSKKEKTLARWKERRSSAYLGSLNHFMRSLYQGNTEQQGFEIRRLVRVKGKEYGRYAPLHTDTLALYDTVRLRSILEAFWRKGISPDTLAAYGRSIGEWMANSRLTQPVVITDSLTPADIAAHRRCSFTKEKGYILAAHYEYSSMPPDPLSGKRMSVSGDGANMLTMARLDKQYDILYSGVLNADSFLIRTDKSLRFRFTGYLQVTYTRELEEYAYLAKKNLFKTGVPEQQRSIISLSNDAELNIQPDGNFYNPYDLLIENYWSYEKLDKLLPLDYLPE